MSRSLPFRSVPTLLAALLVVCWALVAAPPSAGAHNTFQTSTPADATTLTEAPTQISMVFTGAVPLETASAEVIEATGVRTELTGLSHGTSGETELVAPLPALTPGEVTVRWRLVGPDGHPLTGRITFTISVPVSDAIAADTTAATVDPAAPTTLAPLPAGDSPTGIDDRSFSTPSLLRWLLRFASYLAIMVLVGVVLTDAFVWPGAARRPELRRAVDATLGLIAGLAFLQATILASDIDGRAPWRSFGSLDLAVRTDAGLALALRTFIAGCVWLLVRRSAIRQLDLRWTALTVAGVALMSTWAFAGHGASQRWADLGVPIDVAHHLAAAAWIGSLAIVGRIALRVAPPDDLVGIVQRLARLAATAVAVLVVTGLVQSVRLVGSPADLFEAAHGRLLAGKLIVMAGLLAAASANRRRVLAIARRPEAAPGEATQLIRRTIGVEVVLGALILALTAAMVVSPPASSAASEARRPPANPDSYTV